MARFHTAFGIFFVGLLSSASAFAQPTGAPSSSLEAPPLPGEFSPSQSSSQGDGPPLLLGKPIAIGGFGGIDVAYSRMFGKDGVVGGIQGAVILDHHLSIGLAGYGWSRSQPGAFVDDNQVRDYDTGYGGVTLHYAFYFPGLPIYLNVGGLIGGGDIASHDESERSRSYREDAFAVFQPDASLEANLTRWMRVGITGGYRWTQGVGRSGYTNADLNGAVIGGHIQFGRF